MEAPPGAREGQAASPERHQALRGLQERGASPGRARSRALRLSDSKGISIHFLFGLTYSGLCPQGDWERYEASLKPEQRCFYEVLQEGRPHRYWLVRREFKATAGICPRNDRSPPSTAPHTITCASFSCPLTRVRLLLRPQDCDLHVPDSAITGTAQDLVDSVSRARRRPPAPAPPLSEPIGAVPATADSEHAERAAGQIHEAPVTMSLFGH